MRNEYRYTSPPGALRRRGIQLDNFSLVSANLLADIAEWQTFTDQQPKGTAVMVMPSPTSKLRRVYSAVARVLKERGKTARLFSVKAIY